MQQVDTDLLYPALRMAGVLTAAGRKASASQLADAFQAVNRMIDAWRLERLLVFTVRVDRYTLSPSQTSYTIGPGGNFDAPRPTRITAANIVTTSGGSEVHLPLRILTDREWSAKRLTVIPTTIPTQLYFDGAFPVSRLYLWGYPTEANDLELYTWQQLDGFDTQTDPVDVPPAYLDALVYGLAVRLGHMFGTAVRGDILTQATRARAVIKAFNSTSPQIASADYGMRGGRGGSFNYISGADR